MRIGLIKFVFDISQYGQSQVTNQEMTSDVVRKSYIHGSSLQLGFKVPEAVLDSPQSSVDFDYVFG